MLFPTWVRTTRESLKMTKRECAKRAGVHEVVWGKYEDEEANRQPQRKTIEKIGIGLGLPTGDIQQALMLSSPTNTSNRRERIAARIGAKVENLPEEKFARLLDYLDRQTDEGLTLLTG